MLSPRVLSHYPTKIFLAIAVLLPINLACATDQAEKLRSERSVSIGSDLSLSVLGGQYRAKSNPNLGFDVAVSRSVHGIGYSEISNPGNLFSNALNDALRNVKVTGYTVDGGVSWFPFSNSAFRTGLHLSVEQAQTVFSALLKDSTSSAELPRVTYDRQAVYVGIPVGWHWLWDNGITWGLDVGPRLRLTSKKTIENDGGPTADAADRDKYIADAEDRRKVLFGGLITYLGYSF